jgi:L-amino acid N-acyltransferase
MRIVSCTPEGHAESILGILNEAIENSTAIYDYKSRPLSSMEGWFETKLAGEFPVIGVESEEGQLLGFASYGTFRAWLDLAFYQLTLETPSTPIDE